MGVKLEALLCEAVEAAWDIQIPSPVRLCVGISRFITFLHLANVLIQHDLQQANEVEWSLTRMLWGCSAYVCVCMHSCSICASVAVWFDLQALILYKNAPVCSYLELNKKKLHFFNLQMIIYQCISMWQKLKMFVESRLMEKCLVMFTHQSHNVINT